MHKQVLQVQSFTEIGGVYSIARKGTMNAEWKSNSQETAINLLTNYLTNYLPN